MPKLKVEWEGEEIAVNLKAVPDRIIINGRTMNLWVQKKWLAVIELEKSLWLVAKERHESL